MTPNLQLYNKAYETLQGYGFPIELFVNMGVRFFYYSYSTLRDIEIKLRYII